jgi:TIR domain
VFVFLCYSRIDKEITQLIDASLLAAGVPTFRDEKDILVGDSFPERLYESLERASHLLYIISANSVKSNWVQEELSVAKVKQKEGDGFKILPVLVDETELPRAVRHIQYADMREWQDRDKYRRSFLAILRSLGIEARLVGTEDLTWYASHSGELRGIHSRLQMIAGQLTGGLAASAGWAEPRHYMATKWSFEDDDVREVLQSLSTLLQSSPAGSTRLSALKTKVEEGCHYATVKISKRSDYEDADKVWNFQRILSSIASMIDELRGEIEVTVLASVSYPSNS